jgi:hypothetical protein
MTPHVPNLVALAMLVATVITYQIQVRLVEEHYLEQVHGEAYGRTPSGPGGSYPGSGRKAPMRVGAGGRLRRGARLPS